LTLEDDEHDVDVVVFSVPALSSLNRDCRVETLRKETCHKHKLSSRIILLRNGERNRTHFRLRISNASSLP
uniref:MSP domain-containing protein n=1 Tax=Haemonchus placei TaxID=6290 RepID=A0A0N4X3S2_HAEPC